MKEQIIDTIIQAGTEKLKLEKIKKNLISICEQKITDKKTNEIKIKYPLEWKIYNDKNLNTTAGILDVINEQTKQKYIEKIEHKKEKIKKGEYDNYIKLHYLTNNK